MSMFAWDESFSVSVAEFDNHHKKLVSLVNELHDAMKIGKSKEIMSEILKRLIDYTAQHFAAEEKQLQKFNYPDFNKHKLEHEKLVNKVLAFQKDFETGVVMITVDLMSFLKDWLVNHIQKTDKAYGAFLNEHGMK